jgi:hypothetical protein
MSDTSEICNRESWNADRGAQMLRNCKRVSGCPFLAAADRARRSCMAVRGSIEPGGSGAAARASTPKQGLCQPFCRYFSMVNVLICS